MDSIIARVNKRPAAGIILIGCGQKNLYCEARPCKAAPLLVYRWPIW